MAITDAPERHLLKTWTQAWIWWLFRGFRRYLPILFPILLLCLTGAETWALSQRPWNTEAAIGGADSALLRSGFYTKELSDQGIPFRWTDGRGVIAVPWVRSRYIVSLRAENGTGKPYQVAFQEGTSFNLRPETGFRSYHVLWSPGYRWGLSEGLGAQELSLSSKAWSRGSGDPRGLGIALSGLGFNGLDIDPWPLAPLFVTCLPVVALALLLYPWSRFDLMLLAGMALALPAIYDLLVWHPPVGMNYTWLPLSWLPWLTTLALTGLVCLHLATDSRRGALFGLIVAGLILTSLLVSLRLHWEVTGPDYGWHLNHGGSWERVLRAHEFYPFGFPLVLWLGQLWEGRPLQWGQAACLMATLVTFGAIVALAWRLLGREHALVSALLLLCSPVFVAYGVFASTDALMVAPVALALLILCWSPRCRMVHLVPAGLFLGLAYLFRYQTLLLLPPVLLWLSLDRPNDELPLWLRRAGRAAPALLVLAGFLAGSAPQWLLDIRDVGFPFATKQYTNIWTFAYQRADPLPATAAGNEIWFILNYDPTALWHHWMDNIYNVLVSKIHELLIWPIGLLTLLGIVMVVFYQRDRRYLLLLLWVVSYVLAVALTANKDRFFLPVLPALIVFTASWMLQIRDRLAMAGGRWLPLYRGMQVGLWCWALTHLLVAERVLDVYGSALSR